MAVQSNKDRSRIWLLEYPLIYWPNIAVKYAFYLWWFVTPIAGCVHGKWKLEYHMVSHLTSLWQANMGNHMKNILYIWFSHFTSTETHQCQNYSLSLYLKKKKKPVWPIWWQWIKTVSKIVRLWLKDLKWCPYWYILLQIIHIIANHDDKST